MWDRFDGFGRIVLILGASFVLGAIALLIVMLTFELEPDAFYDLLILCVVLGIFGAISLWLVYKEASLKIGIVERIGERRRIAVAASLLERYRGTDLINTPEAGALPTPIYRCERCGYSYSKTADRMYWVDEQPMLSAGWYREECVDKLQDKPRHERLNMEIFLIMLDSDLGAD